MTYLFVKKKVLRSTLHRFNISTIQLLFSKQLLKFRVGYALLLGPFELGKGFTVDKEVRGVEKRRVVILLTYRTSRNFPYFLTDKISRELEISSATLTTG
jgi:hypothetical protein